MNRPYNLFLEPDVSNRPVSGTSCAGRPLEPDLNDSGALNIAPWWELTSWKEVRQYWEDLLTGKYEGSSIGRQLREKGLVKGLP